MNPIAVVILICSASLDRPDCQLNTALDVIRGPNVANEMMCALPRQTTCYCALSAACRYLPWASPAMAAATCPDRETAKNGFEWVAVSEAAIVDVGSPIP
jgi:hypothetical protein